MGELWAELAQASAISAQCIRPGDKPHRDRKGAVTA